MLLEDRVVAGEHVRVSAKRRSGHRQGPIELGGGKGLAEHPAGDAKGRLELVKREPVRGCIGEEGRQPSVHQADEPDADLVVAGLELDADPVSRPV